MKVFECRRHCEDSTSSGAKCLIDDPPTQVVGGPPAQLCDSAPCTKLRGALSHMRYTPGLYLPMTSHLKRMAEIGATIRVDNRATEMASSRDPSRSKKEESTKPVICESTNRIIAHVTDALRGYIATFGWAFQLAVIRHSLVMYHAPEV